MYDFKRVILHMKCSIRSVMSVIYTQSAIYTQSVIYIQIVIFHIECNFTLYV